jgi:RNA 2',3'-cyclic 3'-phosphodiesterase
MDDIRLFVGIRPPREVRDAIDSARARLEAQIGDRAVRWIRPENYHLTLHFLGNTPRALVDDVALAMRAAAGPASSGAVGPIELALGNLSAFPDVRRPRVVVVTVDDPVRGLEQTAQRLLAALRGRLGDEAVRIDDRPFNPHLTLGYLRRGAARDDRRAVAPALESARIEPMRFRADQLLLVHSIPGPGGSRYTEIDSVALGVTPPAQS